MKKFGEIKVCGFAECTEGVAENSYFCKEHQPGEFIALGNAPAHYSKQGIDAIGVMELNYSREALEGFFAGNALKYIIRYKDKNGVEDLEKAKDYIDRIIKLYTSS